MMQRRICVLITAAFATACHSTDRATNAHVERRTIGDTTIVRTISGSAWGDTARLVEEIRIGALDGPKELTFGEINLVAAGKDGSIYAFDDQAVALRQFDSTGAFVRTIGRRGKGPGEYSSSVWDLRMFPDGRVAIYDYYAPGATVYSASGATLLTLVPIPGVAWSPQSIAIDTANNLYVLARRPGSERQRVQPGEQPDSSILGPVLLRIDSSGTVVDTLAIPRRSYPKEALWMGPTAQWALHPHGYFVAGMNDRYSFDLWKPRGRLRVERVVPPVEFEPEERAEIERDIAGYVGVPGPEGHYFIIPAGTLKLASVKPAYRELLAADDGRIWVSLYTRARKTEAAPALPRGDGQPTRPPKLWREPGVYDVFEPDGSYLGPVAVPSNATLRYMRGNHVWGTVRGESDEQYIVRWKLVTPSDD